MVPSRSTMFLLALLVAPVSAVRTRYCDDDLSIPAKNLTRGMTLRIGMYAGELATCNHEKVGTGISGGQPCQLWQQVTREENKECRDAACTDFTFKYWSGFDIDLIEALAVEGGWASYHIISMGGGGAQAVGSTDYDGNNCTTRAATSSTIQANPAATTEYQRSDGYWYTECSSYTGKAKILLGLDNPSEFAVGAAGQRKEAPYSYVSEQDNVSVDFIGNPTWKVNADREDWAIWSAAAVSGDTLLLTAPERFYKDEYDSTLMFQPFKNEVWYLLFGLAILFSGIFKVTATKFKKTAMEISPADIAYHTVMQPCGKDLIDVNQAKIKGISMGWIIFCVVIMEFWFAGLTALLVRDGQYSVPITWNDLKSSSGTKSLCVENAAANDLYFTSLTDTTEGLGYSYKVERVIDTVSKASGVIDGSCDASEVTIEDYNSDERFRGSGQCPAVLAGQAIAQRTRGMMSRRSASCIITSVNGLIHSYGNKQCTASSSNPTKCNLYALWQHHFPAPTCNIRSKDQDAQEDTALGIDALGSPLYILLFFTLFGAAGTWVGKRNERKSVWPISLFLESPEAQHVRLMEKLEQLSTAQDAVHVSKATMKRRVAAGESILPPPSGPPPDDGKSGKGGGGLRKAQTETQRILAEQLENARNRAQRANPTNQAYAYNAQPQQQQQQFVQPAATQPALPAGWSSAMDYASGHTYYMNHITQTTQWTFPTAAQAQPAAATAATYPPVQSTPQTAAVTGYPATAVAQAGANDRANIASLWGNASNNAAQAQREVRINSQV